MHRDSRLRGLSSDHHHALVLARTIRRGLDASTPVTELIELLDHTFDRELDPHFAIEEDLLLPALAAAGAVELADRTRREHAGLRALRHAAHHGSTGPLLEFAQLLEAHVRFEEREVFPACEERVPTEVLEAVAVRRPAPGGPG